jgi:hypothetical protein
VEHVQVRQGFTGNLNEFPVRQGFVGHVLDL